MPARSRGQKKVALVKLACNLTLAASFTLVPLTDTVTLSLLAIGITLDLKMILVMVVSPTRGPVVFTLCRCVHWAAGVVLPAIDNTLVIVHKIGGKLKRLQSNGGIPKLAWWKLKQKQPELIQLSS